MSKFGGLAKRFDGWMNVVTNLGIKNKDKKTGMRVSTTFLDKDTQSAIYQGDDLAAKIVDMLPDDMTREGFDVNIEGDEDLANQAETEFEMWGLDCKLADTYRWGRLYGTGMLLIGVDDGKDPSEPLVLEDIKKVEYFTVLDRHQMEVCDGLTTDVTDPNFGHPEFYQLSIDSDPRSGDSQLNTKIHHSRFIRLDGIKLSKWLLEENSYWGSSLLDRLWEPLSGYATAHNSVPTIINDFTIPVFEMEDLTELLAAGKENLIYQRIGMVQGSSSVVNAIVTRKGEKFERQSTNVAGLKDLLIDTDTRLVAAASMPHTILFGESPSGLGATGESEKNDWFNYVKTQQEKTLRQPILRLLEILFAQKDGFAKGNVPENFSIKFKSLFQEPESKISETRKKVAETDKMYIEMGVLTSDEVAKSRFGGTEYSMETTIDTEAREEFEKPVPDDEVKEGITQINQTLQAMNKVKEPETDDKE